LASALVIWAVTASPCSQLAQSHEEKGNAQKRDANGYSNQVGQRIGKGEIVVGACADWTGEMAPQDRLIVTLRERGKPASPNRAHLTASAWFGVFPD
jgi:hypothetical protein